MVEKTGDFWIQQSKYSLQDLNSESEKAVANNPDVALIIQADEAISHGLVVCFEHSTKGRSCEYAYRREKRNSGLNCDVIIGVMKSPFPKKSRKAHWLRWTALTISVLAFFVIFGQGGLIHNYTLKLKLDSVVERSDDVETHNARQRELITKIRNNPEVAKRMMTKMASVAPQGSGNFIDSPQKDTTEEEVIKSGDDLGAIGRFKEFVGY